MKRRSQKAVVAFNLATAANASKAVRKNEAFLYDVARMDRAVSSQQEFQMMVLGFKPPELVGVLTTSTRVSIDEFLRLVRRWRMDAGRLHPRRACPPRADRRFEYLLALEFGPHPSDHHMGRLHGHALLWNVGQVPIDALRAAWRAISGTRRESEPLLERYQPGMNGVGYALKTLHTDADLISFSPRLVLRIGELSHGARKS
jgi:hypothetical protein